MTEPAEPRNPNQKKPAPKPGTELTERDLDQVSGGVASTTKTTSPTGPIPIPYPNISTS